MMVARDELVERQPAIRRVLEQLQTFLRKLLGSHDLIQGLFALRDGDGHVVTASGKDHSSLGDLVQKIFHFTNLHEKSKSFLK